MQDPSAANVSPVAARARAKPSPEIAAGEGIAISFT